MTTKSRMIMGAAILLAVCVIVSVMPLLWRSFSGETVDIQALIFSISIILLGIISVPIVYLSKIKKDKIEKSLFSEYLSEYEVIKEIVMNSQLKNRVKKEITNDVLDLLISAQNHGKSFKSAIGDSREFADNIIKEYGTSRGFSYLKLIDSVLYMICFVLGTSFVVWLEDIRISFYDVKIDISIIVLFVVISFVIIPLLKGSAASNKPVIVFLPIGVGVIFVLVMELMRRYFSEVGFVKWFLDYQLSIVSNLFILISMIIVIPGLVFLKYYLKSRKVKIFQE